MFTLKETICPKICSKLRLKSAKGPLPVDLRRSKTSLLKVLLKTYIKWNLFTSYEGNSQHHFVCLFLAQRSHRNCARVSHSMGQFFPWNQPHYWKRSEVIQLRSPTPIITNVTAIGTRTPSQEAFILGDPGADSGDEGKSKRAEKYDILYFSSFHIYFPARLDFPSPPVSAPGSPRMGSVLRVLEKRETSTAKVRARDSRINRETGF